MLSVTLNVYILIKLFLPYSKSRLIKYLTNSCLNLQNLLKMFVKLILSMVTFSMDVPKYLFIYLFRGRAVPTFFETHPSNYLEFYRKLKPRN